MPPVGNFAGRLAQGWRCVLRGICTPSQWAGQDSKGTVTPVNLGAPELLIVLLVVLVLFGGAKLPKLARSMGQAQTEFKKGLREGSRHDDEDEPTKAD
jgi:sec-independent protein translocase protein TatA